MSSIKATYTNGVIVPDEAVDWPEGCRLEVREAFPDEIKFMTEEEQETDPESIQIWIRQLEAIPHLQMSAEQESAMMAWRAKVKAFNLDAIRQQMNEGIP